MTRATSAAAFAVLSLAVPFEQETFGGDVVVRKKIAHSPKVDLNRARAAGLIVPRAVAPFPLTETFNLNSRPSATKVIYLDFNGHSTTGTQWNDGLATTLTTRAFSFEGDSTFTDNEKTRIQLIWQRVSEYFSPFDVNVTTVAPTVTNLLRTGGTDTRWGIRVAIGATSPSPAPGAGGVAFVDAFGWDFGTGNDTPAYVFSPDLSNDTKWVADAIVHEVGHTLGLDHDGRNSPSEDYYTGHGSGATKWAPIMGVGYYANIVQWSKGEYPSASNTEDDLSIITTLNGFTYRADDCGTGIAASKLMAVSPTTGGFAINQTGVIERRTDTDWYKFVVSKDGTITINAKGATDATMLDIALSLRNSSGTTLQTGKPLTLLSASITRTVTAGTYYLVIDGTGVGTTTTGYSDYGSLGQYKITGFIP